MRLCFQPITKCLGRTFNLVWEARQGVDQWGGEFSGGPVVRTQSFCCCVVQLQSHVGLLVTPWTAAWQPSLPFAISQISSKPCPLSRWCYPAVLSSVVPFSSCPQSFPALGSFLMSQLLHQVAKVWELQHQSFQWIFRVDFLYDWLVWSPCSPKDSQ